MIIDSLSNIDRYVSLHPHFKKAFEYLCSQEIESIETGKYHLEGDDLTAIVSEGKGRTMEESRAKFECHNRFIDIQFCIRGIEKIGWKPREKCKKENGSYNSEKDVTYFRDTPDTFFQLTDNQFAIFFPQDVHAPMIGNGIIKKVVVKVKV